MSPVGHCFPCGGKGGFPEGRFRPLLSHTKGSPAHEEAEPFPLASSSPFSAFEPLRLLGCSAGEGSHPLGLKASWLGRTGPVVTRGLLHLPWPCAVSTAALGCLRHCCVGLETVWPSSGLQPPYSPKPSLLPGLGEYTALPSLAVLGDGGKLQS